MRAASSTWRGSTIAPSAAAVCAASSRIPSALRASPPARAAISSSTSGVELDPELAGAAPHDLAQLARRVSASSSYTCIRESSAELSSKYGFSVVAPISVTSPSSTPGSSASCWRLVEAVDLVEEEDRPPAGRPEPLAGAARAPRARSPTVAETAESSSNSAPVTPATIRASVVLPVPGRAVEDERRHPVGLDREPERAARPDHVLLPDEAVERRGPQPLGERRRRLEPPPGGFLEEIAHARQYAPGAAWSWSFGTRQMYERLATVLEPVHDELVERLRRSGRASAGSTSAPGPARSRSGPPAPAPTSPRSTAPRR